MKKEKTAAKKGILSFKEIIMFSFGLAGVQCIISYINSYQTQFYNATMGTNFTVIAIILLAAKLISAFIDPFIGRMIDKSNLKGGKLKPFIVIGSVVFAVMTFVIFTAVPFRGLWLNVYIFITFLLWSIAMTLVDVPTQGMLSIMSPDLNDRNKTAGVANLIKGGGFIACFIIVPIVCAACKTGDNPMQQKEYFISTVVIVVMGLILISLLYFFTKERVPYTDSSVSTREMFRMVKENKPLMLVFLSIVLGCCRSMSAIIQVQAAAAVIGTVKIGDFVLSGENAGLIMGLGAPVGTAISSALMPYFNNKWGEKKTFIVFAVYGFVVCTASFLIYLAGVTSILSVVICLFFVGFMYGPHSFLPLVMVPDCVDYYELKTGKRTDGIHFSVLSLANKLSAALGVAIGLAMIGFSRYSAGAAEYSVFTKNVIYGTYVWLPGISCILSMIPIFWYKLTGDEKRRVASELAKRHEEEASRVK